MTSLSTSLQHTMAISNSRERFSAFAATLFPILESLNATTIPGETSTTTPRSPTKDDEDMLRIMKEREAFYATYNVWTGVRTAVTLTLFFLFTVTVILYKSKCKRHRRYELYPSLEDIPGRPVEFYDYWCQTQTGGGDNASSCSRKVDVQDNYCRAFEEASGDVVGSAPIPTHLDRDSLSSYYNSFRIKSLPGSAMRINFSRMGSYEREEAVQYATASGRQEYLRVPGVRLQSTGSSSDGCSLGSSSYEIPYDNTPLTLLNVPGMTGKQHKPTMQTGGIDWDNDQTKADWLQTIDINVIHPTPNVSPCGSVRSISDHFYDGSHCLTVPSRGRSGSFVSVDSQECETRSIVSDSVFYDNSTSEQDSDKVKASDSNGRIKRTQSLSVAQVHSKTKNDSQQIKRKVHSFRLPINPKAALSPMPEILQGKSLKPSDSLMSTAVNNQTPVTSNLSIPLGSHLSTSCERLSSHSAILSEYDNVSRQTSGGTLNHGSSFEDDPVISSYKVPVLRRCNSATTPDVDDETKTTQFKRADSDVPKVQRSDSADMKRQTSTTSSSGSDEVSDSVSFHLFVPHLSVECPSADTSRASSPSLSPTPPGSPTFGASLSVPTPSFHRSTSPSRGKVRGIPERGILKRQFSQYIPSSPREKPPSPFGLPTSFEEEEENEEENDQKGQKVEGNSIADSHIPKYDTFVRNASIETNLYLESKSKKTPPKEYYNKFPNENETKF